MADLDPAKIREAALHSVGDHHLLHECADEIERLRKHIARWRHLAETGADEVIALRTQLAQEKENAIKAGALYRQHIDTYSRLSGAPEGMDFRQRALYEACHRAANRAYDGFKDWHPRPGDTLAVTINLDYSDDPMDHWKIIREGIEG